jgi:hypothetical protein
MSSTLLLPPRAQLCNRSCSNKTPSQLCLLGKWEGNEGLEVLIALIVPKLGIMWNYEARYELGVSIQLTRVPWEFRFNDDDAFYLFLQKQKRAYGHIPILA